MKSRAIHQKTAVALYAMLSEAYDHSDPDGIGNLAEWAAERAKHAPTFKFWLLVLNLEVILLSFVKSVREGNFKLYKESIRNMIPFFFSFNHPHYARWLSVRLQDMETLPDVCPDVNKNFEAGINSLCLLLFIQSLNATLLTSG